VPQVRAFMGGTLTQKKDFGGLRDLGHDRFRFHSLCKGRDYEKDPQCWFVVMFQVDEKTKRRRVAALHTGYLECGALAPLLSG